MKKFSVIIKWENISYGTLGCLLKQIDDEVDDPTTIEIFECEEVKTL